MQGEKPALTEPDPSERRTAPRRMLRGTAYVVVAGRSEAVPVRTLDVSLGGLCVVVPVAMPRGMRCTASFTMPIDADHQHTVEVAARVVYSHLSRQHDGFKSGLQFVELRGLDRTAIEAYMAG